MSWHLLERLLDEISKQSTIFGKVWLTFYFILRVIPLTRMGESVYGDEQAAFKCNVKQLGCENVCFNQFSPISPIRFWGLQMVLVVTPPTLFLIYSLQCINGISAAKMAKRKLMMLKEQQIKKFKTTHLRGMKVIDSIFEENKKADLYPEEANGLWKCSYRRNTNRIAKSTSDVEFFDIKDLSNRNRRKQKQVCSRHHQSDEVGLLFDNVNLRNFSNSSQLYYEDYSNTSCDSRNTLITTQLESAESFTSNDFRKYATIIRIPDEFSPSLHVEHSLSKSANEHRETWASNGYITEEENLTILKMKKKKILDVVEVSKVTSSHVNSMKRRSVVISSDNKAMNSTRKTWFDTSESLKNKRLEAILENKIQATHVISDDETSQLLQLKQLEEKISHQVKFKRSVRGVAVAYLIQCIARLLVDAVFAYWQYKLFHFDVPDTYKCNRWPCPNTVDCYVSRAHEKSFMLHFMFNNAAFAIFLTFCEICFLCYRLSVEYMQRRRSSSATKSRNESLLKDKKNQLSSVIRKNSKRALLAAKSVQNTTEADSDSATDETRGSFNSEELSAMLENELMEEIEINEDQDDEMDDVD